MTERSFQVTYRKGRPFSAYLHLSHETGEKSGRTVPSADGLLVRVHRMFPDFAAAHAGSPLLAEREIHMNMTGLQRSLP